MKTRSQCGNGVRRLALWPRLLAVFCMALIAAASTVQVCHSHDDAFEASLLKSAFAAHSADGQVEQAKSVQSSSKTPGRRDSDSDSSVRCPLCVAMHSALPVSGLLVQIALVRLATMAPRADGIERTFRWRFEMASRPPPVREFRA